MSVANSTLHLLDTVPPVRVGAHTLAYLARRREQGGEGVSVLGTDARTGLPVRVVVGAAVELDRVKSDH